tara:strand:+ start:407 stop:1177 length:771 start_codon:yes stop_codon:yes gene_type:complete
LKNLHTEIGTDRYKSSLIRREHGTGSGFFGVSNTGSADCLKENFRKLTDSLGLSYRHLSNIYYRTETCVATVNFDKKVFRVEHTVELKDLYIEFEEQFICGLQEFSPAAIAAWIVRNQVTCLIKQVEQRSSGDYDVNIPFSKYNRSVFDDSGCDVSRLSRGQLIELNDARYSNELKAISIWDFEAAITKAETALLRRPKQKHTLPDINVARDHVDQEFPLIKSHYHHKLEKISNPNSKWYSPDRLARYYKWSSEST